MTRTVADTNILVSAFLWSGAPREVLHAARRETITLFTSAALIAELEEVLAREKFAKPLSDVGSSVEETIGDGIAVSATTAVNQVDELPRLGEALSGV